MLDIRQTPEYAGYLSNIGWIVERKNQVNYFVRKFPVIGSVLKIQRPKTIDDRVIRALCKKYRVFQIILEPDLSSSRGSFHIDSYYHHEFRLSKSPYLPSKTLQLNLDASIKQIEKTIKKDARLAIKKNRQVRIVSYKMAEINEFRNAWTKSVGMKRYVSPLTHLLALKKSFGKKSLFITDENKNGGAIFLRTKDTCYYWQAFTNELGRKRQTQYKVVWEGILWAKRNKCKLFDFEGIYDERFPNKSWLGFSHFKKSFGGKEIEYPGCYTKTNLLNNI